MGYMSVYKVYTAVPYFKIKVHIWLCEALDMNYANDPQPLYVNLTKML